MQISLPQKPKYAASSDKSGVFEIEGCYPGYGTTIGNAIRRVMLSSLPGAAIISVKIKGIKHEFSTVPNVLEDVIQIILNLKQVRFRIFSEEPVKVSLKVKGEKKVDAGMIECPSSAEVVNKEAHIATLTSAKAELEMEMEISSGVGYVPVEQQEREKKEVGVIALDAIYTPVRKVNYVISDMRVGKRTDFEKITLDVVTDGSITPLEAFSKSVEILVDQFSQLKNLQNNEVGEEEENKEKKEVFLEEKKEEKKEKSEKEEKEVDSLKKEVISLKNLSTRTLNVLEKNKIKDIEDIVKKSENELLEMEGMGAKGIKEIKKAIGDFGLNLKKAE